MIRRFTHLLFTFVVANCSMAALACSPPDSSVKIDSAAIISSLPAKNVPKGAIQLEVGVPDQTQMANEPVTGKITLTVKQVLNGKFASPSIRLNTTNVDNCDSHFGFVYKKAYVTVLPMEYSDGEPILDRDGMQEFGALFYEDSFSPPEFYEDSFSPPEEGEAIPKFAEYGRMTDINSSFFDLERLNCLQEGGEVSDGPPAKVWRKCVAPGEYVGLHCQNNNNGKLVCEESNWLDNRPKDLRRGYTFIGEYGAAMAAVLLTLIAIIGTVVVFRKRRLAAS